MLLPLMQSEAEALAAKVLNALNYRGVLCIELFDHDGRLVVNEMACRVHNSGHWTIEGAEISQFENHLRAGLGLPLGSTRALGFSAMLNLVGETGDTRAALGVRGAHLHLYNKQPKPGRKLGHITLVADDVEEREERIAELLAAVKHL
jgi:5-(carboxyamino)imidazole ribonucleotide synthase